MGMSTHIKAIGEPAAKHQKMYAVWESCRDAGLEVPMAVQKYFNWDSPDPKGLQIDLGQHECCSEINEESCSGFEVDVRKLPEGITYIRFYNSY